MQDEREHGVRRIRREAILSVAPNPDELRRADVADNTLRPVAEIERRWPHGAKENPTVDVLGRLGRLHEQRFDLFEFLNDLWLGPDVLVSIYIEADPRGPASLKLTDCNVGSLEERW